MTFVFHGIRVDTFVDTACSGKQGGTGIDGQTSTADDAKTVGGGGNADGGLCVTARLHPSRRSGPFALPQHRRHQTETLHEFPTEKTLEREAKLPQKLAQVKID
jgi:hypothetical protein